jgi:hypothetical protein
VGVLVNVYCTLTEVFLTLTEVFPCFFLSCRANARLKLAKTGHGPQSSTLVCICVVRLLFVLFCVLFVCKCVLPPSDNPTAVNKCISYIKYVCFGMSVHYMLHTWLLIFKVYCCNFQIDCTLLKENCTHNTVVTL